MCDDKFCNTNNFHCTERDREPWEEFREKRFVVVVVARKRYKFSFHTMCLVCNTFEGNDEHDNAAHEQMWSRPRSLQNVNL